MEFSQRKLPKSAALELRIFPIHTVKPYVLMLAPAYVLMKLNEKFVSVKAPLDFFTPEEIERLKPYESLFLSRFVDSVQPFQSAAHALRALLSWKPQEKPTKPGSYPEVSMTPTPYEVSDAVLRTIGPLWGEGPVIEPFFVAVFVNELCDQIPPELLRRVRDQDIEGYEYALLCSSWVVFLALHLGYCNLDFLNMLRLKVFSGISSSDLTESLEVSELIRVALTTLGEMPASPSGPKVPRTMEGSLFSDRSERISQKLTSRLKRVTKEFIDSTAPIPTIYGKKGFVDV